MMATAIISVFREKYLASVEAVVFNEAYVKTRKNFKTLWAMPLEADALLARYKTERFGVVF